VKSKVYVAFKKVKKGLFKKKLKNQMSFSGA